MEYPIHLHWNERAAAYIAEAVDFPGGLVAQGKTQGEAMGEIYRLIEEHQKKPVPMKGKA